MEVNYVVNQGCERLILRPTTEVERDVLSLFKLVDVCHDVDCGRPVLILTARATVNALTPIANTAKEVCAPETVPSPARKMFTVKRKLTLLEKQHMKWLVMRTSGKSNVKRAIADMYGIHVNNVNALLRGSAYKSITPVRPPAETTAWLRDVVLDGRKEGQTNEPV